MSLSVITRAVIISILIVGIICSNSKRVLERIKYLEHRINTESQFRNEEYADVIDRLDAIDKQLNVFTERRVGFVNSDQKSGDANADNVYQLRDDFTRIRKAFREEKSETARVRREIPRIENDLTAVKHDLEYYCTQNLNKTDELISRVEESDDLFKTDMVLTINEINELKYVLENTPNITSILVRQEFKVTAEQMEERMQRTVKELEIMENTKRQEITAVKHDVEYYSTKNLNKTDELISRVEQIVDERMQRTVKELEIMQNTTRQEILTAVKHDVEYYSTKNLNKTDELITRVEQIVEERMQRTVKELEIMENTKRQEILTAVKHYLEYYCTKNLNKTDELMSLVEESDDMLKTNMKSALQRSREEFKKIIEESMQKTVKELEIMENTKRQKIAQTKAKVENIEILVSHLSASLIRYSSCSEAKSAGPLLSGVYTLQQGPEVYCDQTTDGGGWLVFQRRQNGEIDFYRNWAEYKHGFGNLNSEFWLGNEHLSSLTAVGGHELRIDIEDFDGNKAYAKYSKFKIYPEEEKYKLEVSGFSGNAGDSLEYHNGMAFTTFDQDNDKYVSRNCATKYHGAWWYKSCHYSNLNGQYFNEPREIDYTGINWSKWKRGFRLKYVEMKFR